MLMVRKDDGSCTSCQVTRKLDKGKVSLGGQIKQHRSEVGDGV